jgi:hypothetical protein
VLNKDKPEKTRGELSEKKVSWNGNRYEEYRKKIEGHLLQVSAGYLIDPEFDQIHNGSMQSTHMAYLQSEPFWSKYSVPFLQARGDRRYLYGILVSSCCQNDNKVILANKKEWMVSWLGQMLRDYDHGGSVDLIDAIECRSHTILFKLRRLDYLADRYQALMAEMDTIAPLGYDDGKKQLLVKNVRHTLEWHTWHSGARMMPVICHVC